ncbi:MAG: hypothetical protein A2Z14_13010 [Chloroflexi bacterium RBG_16_48_8]|nr:MAG: hypothetical protein A2Z14_13010 [Chloroflexi bacterium RBG_16_48_8]
MGMETGSVAGKLPLEEDVRPSFWTKLVYGSGDWSLASFGTLRQVFYAIFLTDAVGWTPVWLRLQHWWV